MSELFRCHRCGALKEGVCDCPDYAKMPMIDADYTALETRVAIYVTGAAEMGDKIREITRYLDRMVEAAKMLTPKLRKQVNELCDTLLAKCKPCPFYGREDGTCDNCPDNPGRADPGRWDGKRYVRER